MVDEACLPGNAYYPRTPDYTLYSGVHVCWSEHSDSSFVYGFMSLEDGLGTMTATTSDDKSIQYKENTRQYTKYCSGFKGCLDTQIMYIGNKIEYCLINSFNFHAKYICIFCHKSIFRELYFVLR